MGRYEATGNGHWIPSATMRRWLYGVGIALSVLAVAYGFVTESEAGLWVSLVGAILGVNNAVAARNTTNGDGHNNTPGDNA